MSQTYCTIKHWDLKLGWLSTTAFAFKSLSLELALPVRSGKPISTGFGASVKWTLHNLGADGILMACDGDWSQMCTHVRSRSPCSRETFRCYSSTINVLWHFLFRLALVVSIAEYSAFTLVRWLRTEKNMCMALLLFSVIMATAYRIPDLVTSVMIRSQCWQWLSREAIRGTQGSDVTHTGTFHTINRVHWNMFFSFTWHTWSKAKTWSKQPLKIVHVVYGCKRKQDSDWMKYSLFKRSSNWGGKMFFHVHVCSSN